MKPVRMTVLRAATEVLIAVCLCDVVANIANAQSRGWDESATLVLIVWLVCLRAEHRRSVNPERKRLPR